MLPRVSVIVPARNAAATIATTLASLEGDSSAIAEVIVVDDGSTDGTAEVARTTGARCGLAVRVIEGGRRGAGAARNVGLLAVQGDWVYFIDADDELRPGGLRAMRDRLAANPDAGVAVGGYIRRIPGRPDKVCQPSRYAAVPSENVRRYLTDQVRSIAMGSAMVRLSAIGGARFAEGLAYEEDTCFWVLALARAKVVTVEHLVLVYNVSLERSDDRFASAARQSYLNTTRSFRRLGAAGPIDRRYLNARKQIIALKAARVCYHRGDLRTAARFIRLVGGAGIGLLRRWQALRYVVKIALARRPASKAAPAAIDPRNLPRLTANR
jgi:glycosyltransferase involved in cell wall biosynthesis